MNKFYCPKCNLFVKVTAAARRVEAMYGLGLKCPWCGSYLETQEVKTPASDSYRRSHAQEKRVAAREQAKCQAASGSRPGYEGDVRKVGSYRGECKLTRNFSYRLQLKDLIQLERQATGFELPVLDIEFQCGNPVRRYVVLPEWVYETLMVESGRRDDGRAPNSNAEGPQKQ